MNVDLATKQCTKCGETKTLTEFYSNAANKDGHHNQCKDCQKAAVKALQARKREELGEDAWREYYRASVSKYRERRGSDPNRSNAAYRQAVKELKEAHASEFEERVRRIRYEMGIE